MNPAFIMWSGGKNCHYALSQAIRRGIQPRYLVSFIDAESGYVMSHKVAPELLEDQAKLLNLELLKVNTSLQTFERDLRNLLFDLRSQGIVRGIFGDIHKRERRDWFELALSNFDMRGLFPLWGIPPHLLITEQMKEMRSTVVEVDQSISEIYLGKDLTMEYVEYLLENGIDPCGEGHVYHTFVCRSSLMSGELFLTHAERYSTPESISLDIDYWKVERSSTSNESDQKPGLEG